MPFLSSLAKAVACKPLSLWPKDKQSTDMKLQFYESDELTFPTSLFSFWYWLCVIKWNVHGPQMGQGTHRWEILVYNEAVVTIF